MLFYKAYLNYIHIYYIGFQTNTGSETVQNIRKVKFAEPPSTTFPSIIATIGRN